MTRARTAPPAELTMRRGIEIGHIFQLGRRFADVFGLDALGPDSKPVRITMGSYGVGVSRLVAAIAEQHHDDKGLNWPAAVAPFDVHVVAAGKGDQIEGRPAHRRGTVRPRPRRPGRRPDRGFGRGEVHRRRADRGADRGCGRRAGWPRASWRYADGDQQPTKTSQLRSFRTNCNRKFDSGNAGPPRSLD